MSRTRPAQVRYYLDADILGLAKVLGQLRPDVTYPGDSGRILHRRQRPPCPITSSAASDTEWIPEVTRRSWLIVTRDSHIKDHRAEIAAVREHGARMIVLAGSEARDTWTQLEVVMCQWRAIEGCLDQPGPFIYAATRTKLRKIDLGGVPPA